MATDPSDFCTCGGPADACGCPADINTQDLMFCPHCAGQWRRRHGDTSTRCLHPHCRRDGSTVARRASYAPTHTADGQLIDPGEPAGTGECFAEFIDGSWTNCGCPDCEDREALDREENGDLT